MGLIQGLVPFTYLLITIQAYMAEATGQPLCRDRLGYWDIDTYNSRSCASCFIFLFPDKQNRVRLSRKGNQLSLLQNGNMTIVEPNIHDENSQAEICRLLTADECYRWAQCCLAAEVCCDEMMQAHTKGKAEDGSCPATWDGFGCWQVTSPSTTVTHSCPGYLAHSEISDHSYKECDENGTWFKRNHLEWSDYTECVEGQLEGFHKKLYISVGCCAVSLLVLVPSVIIFCVYRSLRNQHRVQLHIQLFTSFILQAIVYILWELVIVHNRVSVGQRNAATDQNTTGCKFLYVLTRYTRATNYLWMFCEAFYLHKLIAHAFEPPNSLLIFYLLGWGLPWIPIIAYSIVKLVTADTECWIDNLGGWEWIIYVPNLLSLILNLGFLINILRILLTQLQSHPNEPSNYRRAFKATALLVPLFGLQLFLIIYRPPHGSPGASEYEMISAFITSSQGFFVALIFCLCNSEVHSLFRRTLSKHWPSTQPSNTFTHRASMNSTQVTEAYAMADNGNNKPSKAYIPMTSIVQEEDTGSNVNTVNGMLPQHS